jgi:opacity protein-like surface antigen
MVMKFLITSLFLVANCLAYQPGRNSFGGQIGFTTSEFEVTSGSALITIPSIALFPQEYSNPPLDGDLSGFSYEFSGNVNVYETNSANFGVDLHSYFNGTPGLDDTINGTKVENSVNSLSASVRPFFRTGIFSPFAVIGVQYTSYDVSSDNLSWSKGTEFSPVLGLGGSFQFTEQLVFSPSFTWSKVELPSVSEDDYSFELGSTNSFKFEFPLTYQVSDFFSIGASISHTNFSEAESSSIKVNQGTVDQVIKPLKISYWMTSFMIKGDFVY